MKDDDSETTTILNVGFDDTDSPAGMCTTYLAYVIAGLIRHRGGRGKKGTHARTVRHSSKNNTSHNRRYAGTAEFLDYPRLVRLNPNVPWKTRGNGAVSMRIRTSDPHGIKGMIKDAVFAHADTKHGANPGLVFFEGDAIPSKIAEFSRLALWQLINRGSAKKFAQRCGLEYHHMGNGQGIIGAIGAIGYEWDDHTLELLSYRRPSMCGTPRVISHASVKKMQRLTAPRTFNSYDESRRRILITPRGPDPVFYGIRGEDAQSLVSASHMIQSAESMDGYMIFRTNQGTNAHLRNKLDHTSAKPYASGWVSGTVDACMTDPANEGRGGHVFFEIKADRQRIRCAVYKPTAMTHVARALLPGDMVRVGGGVRRAFNGLPRVLNAEYIEVLSLSRDTYLANPTCTLCAKSMKSKGVGQGFECTRCEGQHADSKCTYERPRTIAPGLYIPDVGAQRHLTRPRQRLGVKNSTVRFDDDDMAWLYHTGVDDV